MPIYGGGGQLGKGGERWVALKYIKRQQSQLSMKNLLKMMYKVDSYRLSM